MARLIPSGPARIVPSVVRDARAEADAIRARATDDAERAREAARVEGLALGESKVIAKMLELGTQQSELRDGAAREVATLALEVASRIVHERVIMDPGLLERVVARTLDRARDESRVELRLHPEDRELLARALAPSGGVPDSIRIVDAPEQHRGGCVVSNERITIDARVESAIEAIARAMGVDAPGR